jgi:hypothetical protein
MLLVMYKRDLHAATAAQNPLLVCATMAERSTICYTFRDKGHCRFGDAYVARCRFLCRRALGVHRSLQLGARHRSACGACVWASLSGVGRSARRLTDPPRRCRYSHSKAATKVSTQDLDDGYRHVRSGPVKGLMEAPQRAAKKAAPRGPRRPTVEDVVQDALTPLARDYWAPGAPELKPYDAKVIQTVYKEELATFVPGRVTILEFSQYFEKCVLHPRAPPPPLLLLLLLACGPRSVKGRASC